MEIGSPMASMYILGFPDHYTNIKFINMYWKIYIYAVKSQWNKISDQHPENVLREAEIVPDENVIVVKKNNGIIHIQNR